MDVNLCSTGSFKLQHETIPSLLQFSTFSVHVLILFRHHLYLFYFKSKKCLPSFQLKLFAFVWKHWLWLLTLKFNKETQQSLVVYMLRTNPGTIWTQIQLAVCETSILIFNLYCNLQPGANLLQTEEFCFSYFHFQNKTNWVIRLN